MTNLIHDGSDEVLAAKIQTVLNRHGVIAK